MNWEITGTGLGQRELQTKSNPTLFNEVKIANSVEGYIIMNVMYKIFKVILPMCSVLGWTTLCSLLSITL